MYGSRMKIILPKKIQKRTVISNPDLESVKSRQDVKQALSFKMVLKSGQILNQSSE